MSTSPSPPDRARIGREIEAEVLARTRSYDVPNAKERAVIRAGVNRCGGGAWVPPGATIAEKATVRAVTIPVRSRRAGRASPVAARVAAKPPASDAHGLLRLQRLAGNQAVCSMQQPVAAVQRDADAAPGKLDEAAVDLYGWLVANAPNVEHALHTILLQKDQRDQLQKTYDTKFKRSLVEDLKALGGDDTIRARCYLKFGTLRPADKIYIAIHGKLTDDTTVMRVVRDIAHDRATSETAFAETYGTEYSATAVLPNGESSRIDGALMAEMMSATFATRFKVEAILAFGAPRAADEVKIATVGPTNDADLLFAALQREETGKLRKDFEASYKEPLRDYLSRETSLHTKKRAMMLVSQEGDPDYVKPEDRLIETVRIAISGYTTADADFIFDAVQHATDAQLVAFRAAVAAKDPRLGDMSATFGGMNKEQLDRLNALVGIGDNSGLLGDPVVKRLRAEGGNGGDAVFDTLKNSTGAAYAEYKKAYVDENSPLHQFVSQFTDASQKGWLLSYVFNDLRSRLNFVMDNPGQDDYLIFLLSSFADDNTRRQLATDSDFGSRFAKLGTATQNKVLIVLQPSNMTPEERAIWLDAAVKRETASGVGSVTANAGALSDENRELQSARERATAGGKTPTPEDQAEIERLSNRTQDALTAFVHYRDELEAAVSTAVDIGVGLLLTAATGGAASIDLILMAAARAAVATAMAKVVSRKIVMGDRFDVIGADGAAAFVSGAVDGMLNVVAPSISKGIMGPALEEAASTAARSAAPQTFRQFAATTGPKMVEGAATGGISSAVDTMTQDKTWADGFDRGMKKVVQGAMTGAATGAAANAAPPAIGAAVAAAGGLSAFEAIIDTLPDAAVSLEKVVISTPLAHVSKLDDHVPIQRADNFGKDFETYVDGQLATNGLNGQLPPMTFILPGAHNHLDNGIDRIGVVIEGDRMTVYHFEMKWRNPPADGQPAPEVKLGKPSLGTQTGGAWTVGALDSLCESTHMTALASRDAARAMLSVATKRPLASVTEAEVKQFLRSSLNATRVIVVPVHVDIRGLMKQVAALTRHGVNVRVVRANVP
jgi:hypothetical protein